MEDLTPEQEAKLLGLRPRDKFRQDDKYQRKLLAALINEPKLSDLIPMIQPYFFAHEAHHDAFKYIKEYYTANREVPTIYMIQEHFKKIHAERDVAIRLHFAAEIHGISTYYTPGLVEINYLRSETIEFVKKLGVKAALLRITDQSDEAKKLSSDDILLSIKNIADDHMKITAPAELTTTWDDICKQQEKEDWLIQNWLEFGSLGLLSGDPFSGKSHIITEIFAGIFKHGTFTRYEINPCPVLLFDAENKKRILVKRLTKALGDGVCDSINKLFHRVDSTRLNLPLPVESGAETVRSLIQEIKKKTNSDRVFVVIDTLRSVFAADEMETADMKKLLYPLQRVAQEENAAILILHHRPKSGATYSGQTSIAGACDYLWLWTSDKSTSIGKLELVGTRGDPEQPLKFKLADGKNEWIPNNHDESEEQQNNIITMLEKVLHDGEMKQSDLVKQVQNLWMGGEVPGVNKIRDLLDSLVGHLLISRRGEKNAIYYSLMGGY